VARFVVRRREAGLGATQCGGALMVRANNQTPGAGPVQDSKTSARPVADAFRKFAHGASSVVGSPWAFLIAVAAIVVWALLGPRFKYSDTWQLVINTGTTIVTFLMVFLIQNTQNRDARAIHLKLDELIRGLHGARNRLVDLEHFTDEQLDDLEKEFRRLRKSGHRVEQREK
jgi:low affinity Fe/Cu permease